MSTKDALGATWERSGYPCNMGSYVLLRSLARGGMGEVHLAKHGGLAGIQKYCVVKTLKRFHSKDEEYVRRFVDEARVVVSLQHKNICPVFDVGRVEGRYYLAMELISGRDLRDLSAETKRLGAEITPSLALFVIGEVLEALDYAHRARDPNTGELLHLVHRDISPQNVMLSSEGEVKLIDFGLAASTLKRERTEPNVVMGKLAYMPPEQMDGKDVDGRADLFAAAVMLYELLVKERYYEGMTDGEILVAASSRDFEPRKLKDIDGELQTILRDALSLDRSQRLPDCGEFKDRLVRYQVHHRLNATPRDLRRLIEKAFPDDPENNRAMLAQYAAQRAPSREDDEPERIAASATAAPPDPAALKGIEELQAMSDDMMAAEGEREIDLEESLFGDLDSLSEPPKSTSPVLPPGRMTPLVSSPAAPLDREPTEPTRDIHIPTPAASAVDPAGSLPPLAVPPNNDPFANVPSSGPAAAAYAAAEATVVIARPRTSETPTSREESTRGVYYAAGIIVLLLAVGAFFMTRGEEPTVAAAPPAAETPPAPHKPPAPEPPPPEPPALQTPVAESSEPQVADGGAQLAEAEAPPLPEPEPEPEPEPAAASTEKAKTAAAAKAAATKKRRARAERLKRAKASKTPLAWKPKTDAAKTNATGPLPKLRGGANPEAKVRYLEMYCRARAKCANKLVGEFRAMRVKDARSFWSKVDACVMICSPGSLQ